MTNLKLTHLNKILEAMSFSYKAEIDSEDNGLLVLSNHGKTITKLRVNNYTFNELVYKTVNVMTSEVLKSVCA